MKAALLINVWTELNLFLAVHKHDTIEEHEISGSNYNTKRPEKYK